MAGGSPKVPTSRKAPAPRVRSAAESSGPGGTGSPGAAAAATGVRRGVDTTVRVASVPTAPPREPDGGRSKVSAERRRSSMTRMSDTMPVRVLSSACARRAASSAPERSSSVIRRRASAKFAS